MFRGSRAPWGRSEDRCDGAGSEADGAKPPVKPGHKMPVLGVLVFVGRSALVKPSSSGLRIHKAREIAGPVLPGAPFAFRGGAGAQLRALDTSMACRREGPDRIEKFFIQSLLRLALLVGHGGLASLVLGDGNSCSGGAQRRTRTYRSWNCTAMVPSNRCSTRTIALRIPARMS